MWASCRGEQVIYTGVSHYMKNNYRKSPFTGHYSCVFGQLLRRSPTT